MKKGAKRMAYPGGDPENGPAYMQQWTGREWICYVHKPEFNPEDRAVYCKNCGIEIMSHKQVRLTINKHLK